MGIINKIVRLTESQMDHVIKEQLIGGFVAPGDEETFKAEEQGPDFGNFIMCGRKLLETGVTMGELTDRLTDLPVPEPPDREENNEYEPTNIASGGVPYSPG
jgi:hypothetical protein